MVQRKVPNKLGLQADHLLKSDKRKPNCFQHQDGKNRGSDMKKKMKRSKPIKITDFESLNSPPTASQPENSPPLCSPATAAAPQKQAMVKSSGGSPNYMKDTTSSEARKERLRKSSDLSKIPAISSSLKKVRTLTKSPNFKVVRSAGKKSSRVALCADVDVQKATCSSTLKDSKFPPYLMLNHGGTESEGTSVLKVCPYTYCSLNGHHHAPSPPLKCFLKTKRRSMKTQKSSKLQASSSPRRVKPSVVETEEISTEVGMDFFVEIYAKKTVDDDEATGEQTENNGDDEAEAEEENKDRVFENMSDASPQSEIDLEEHCVDEFLSFLAEEARAGSCNNESDISGENISDMEWEEAQFSNSEICEEDYKCCITDMFLSEGIKQIDDEPEIIGLNNGVSNCTEEILADDVLQELFHEESAYCSLQCDESDYEMEDVVQNREILEEKSKECERDSGVMIAAISLEESVAESEVTDNNVEGDGDFETESNEFKITTEIDDATDLLQSQIADSSEILDFQKFEETEADQSSGLEELPCGTAEEEEEKIRIQELDNEINSAKTFDHQLEDQHESIDKSKISTSEDSEGQNISRICGISSDGIESGVENTEVEVQTKSDAPRNSQAADNGSRGRSGNGYQRASNSRCELAEASSNRKWTINCRKRVIDEEEERDFNPREPNFLPVVPDPEAEKVDLKHQDMDDRKNAEEWMIDYALQQAVTKLAPARKRKVALLVEAFEKVLPMPKYDPHCIRNTASPFSPRPIQACS